MRPSDCGADDYSSDDEISVGCPSPQHQSGLDEERAEEPKNGSKQQQQAAPKETLLTSQHIRPEESNAETNSDAAKNASGGGVRSFSILDILNHRPSQQQPQQRPSAPESSPVCSAAKIRRKGSNVEAAADPPNGLPNDADSPTKIMRPWDYPHLTLPAHFQAAAAAAAGFLNPNRCLPFVAHPASSPFHLPGPHPFGLQSHPAAGLGFHPHHHPNFHHHLHHHHQRAAGHSSFVGGILSVGGSSSGHLSPSSSSASPDYISAGGSSDCDADDVCSTSGNSATSAGSPLLQQQQRQKTLLNSGTLVVNNNNSASSGSVRKSSAPTSGGHHKKSSGESGKSAAANSAGGTPLDALFQMTSKTFDGSSNNGADSSGEFWFISIRFWRPNSDKKKKNFFSEFRQGLANGPCDSTSLNAIRWPPPCSPRTRPSLQLLYYSLTH